MRWTVHGERPIYQNRWVDLMLVDVEQPDGKRWEYHVVKLRHLAATVLVDEQARVLLMWRHRFITDSWAWEIPMGLIEEGETPEQAAARELEEETGWRAGKIEPIAYAQPANGITDSEHYLFKATHPVHIGAPVELNESDRFEWFPLSEIRAMIDRREIVSSASVVALLYVLLDHKAV